VVSTFLQHVLERTTGTSVSQANSGKAPSQDGQTSEKETRTSTEPLSAAKKVCLCCELFLSAVIIKP